MDGFSNTHPGIAILSQHSTGSEDSGIVDPMDSGLQDYADNPLPPDYDHAHDKLLPQQMKDFSAINKRQFAPQEYTKSVGRPEDRKPKLWAYKQERTKDPPKVEETNFGGEMERDNDIDVHTESEGSDSHDYCPPSQEASRKHESIPPVLVKDKLPKLVVTDNPISTEVSNEKVPFLQPPNSIQVPIEPLPVKTSEHQSVPISTSQTSDDCEWDSETDSDTGNNRYGCVKDVHLEIEDPSDEDNTS